MIPRTIVLLARLGAKMTTGGFTRGFHGEMGSSDKRENHCWKGWYQAKKLHMGQVKNQFFRFSNFYKIPENLK